MMNKVSIALADHRENAIAEAIRSVHALAYAQEAKLLGLTDFPPMHVSTAQIQRSLERFIAASVGRDLVGAVGVEPAGTASWAGGPLHDAHIASLVVHPAFQRQHIGRRLVAAAIALVDGQPITVATARANVPALRLYAQHGFVEQCSTQIGEGTMEIVLLRRA